MLPKSTTELQFFWRDWSIQKAFGCGVSLHSHTIYSEEGLEIIPDWIATALSVHHEKGSALNLRNAFWTPPLTPRQAHCLEEKQIETQLQLPGLVSLTDHDDMHAGTLLRVLDRYRHAPISTEWTIPFAPAFFHLGVHNIPPAEARAIGRELVNFTANPHPGKLDGILADLNSRPDVLLVLNHPLWDEKGIGRRMHERALHSLLESHGRSIHALEVNGFRPWSENSRVLLMGRNLNLPVVAGGDRHGLEPNAILNLSHANVFSEFIHEVRYGRISHVVFMAQYRQPRSLQILQSVIDVLRDYPGNLEGRRAWGERVFYRHPESGALTPFATIQTGNASRMVKHLIAAMRLFDRRVPSIIPTGA